MNEVKHLLIYEKRIKSIKRKLKEFPRIAETYKDDELIRILFYELAIRNVGIFQYDKYMTLITNIWKQGLTLHQIAKEPRTLRNYVESVLFSSLASETKESRIGTLKSILRILKEHDLVDYNISKELRLKQKYNLKKIDEVNIPTREEVEALIDFALTLQLKTIISILVSQGLRIGELLSLQRGNINIEDSKIEMQVEGKTGKRNIVLLGGTKSYLLLHRYLKYNKLVNAPADRYIFRKRGKENKPKSYASVRKQFRRLVKRLKNNGIIDKNKRITLHTLRHFAVSNWSRLGVPEMVMKKQFGWSKSSKMLARYTTISFKVVEEYSERVSRELKL